MNSMTSFDSLKMTFPLFSYINDEIRSVILKKNNQRRGEAYRMLSVNEGPYDHACQSIERVYEWSRMYKKRCEFCDRLFLTGSCTLSSDSWFSWSRWTPRTRKPSIACKWHCRTSRHQSKFSMPHHPLCTKVPKSHCKLGAPNLS